MAQQIQGYSPLADSALRISEKMKGQDGMANGTAPVGANLFDRGPQSKPNVNAQPANNQRLMAQNAQQNLNTRVPLAQAAALGETRKQIVAAAGAESDEQRFMADRVAQMLFANDARATFELGVPEVAAVRHLHAAQQKQLAYGTPTLPMASNNLPA